MSLHRLSPDAGARADYDVSAAAFVDDKDRWAPIRIVAGEKHPQEDVAIVRLQKPPWSSWLTVTGSSGHQACEYDAWGYPVSVAESAATFEEAGLERPELIYTRGYVRRRISRELPISIFRGSAFYELSQQGGAGCSGGPVIMRTSLGQSMWKVFGVYVAEAASPPVAYAVRSDSFHLWEPQIVGRSILAESTEGSSTTP